MTSLLLLLLIFVVLIPGQPFQNPHGWPFRKMHEETALSEHEPCHFPFRFQREMHHSCILSHSVFHKHWCATTENYDRDGKWRYCGEEERPGGHCNPNPCQNGGDCEARRMGFHCICAAGFHGKHCEKENCFGTKGLLHIGRKDTWVRHQPSGSEECHCARKKLVCKPMHGKACTTNPCMNGGHCLEVKHNVVCSCPEGFSGQLCDIEHTQTCYRENGRLYRGMAHYTVSGTPCLPWDSPLLLNEYSSSVNNASIFGLGPHAFCRNPDGDSQPWCYVLRDMQLNWEFCNIPRCHPQYAGTMASATAVPPLAPLETDPMAPKKPESTRPTTAPTQTVPIPAPVCGLRFPKTTTSSRSRVVRGMVALRGSHPYMAAIYIGDQFCGGSLIASCWVLTAAHCLEFRPEVSKISVVLGQTQYNRSTDGSVKFQVQNYLLHEHYSEITKRHDIALVRLKEKAPGHCAELSHSILPACLPNSTETFDTSKPCQIAGWGHMYEGANKLSVYLQEADMPIIPHEQCRSQEVHGTNIAEDMLCAGYMDGRADACQGDSGGPLVCDEQGKATLRGIISWGTGCALENKPGVYTSVTHYLDWIQNHMR